MLFAALPALLLLESEARARTIWIYDVIEVANTRFFRWREEFSHNALECWPAGEQVGIAKRRNHYQNGDG
jgi:hypothetical protein